MKFSGQSRRLDPRRLCRRRATTGRSLGEAVDDGGKNSEREKARFCTNIVVVNGELLGFGPGKSFTVNFFLELRFSRRNEAGGGSQRGLREARYLC